MCKENVREMKTRESYNEVVCLMRRANVIPMSIGSELLEIAIMSYLENPDLTLDSLVGIATENSPMPISDFECFEKMKEALLNLYTKHWQKTDDNNVVWKFIKNVSAEVRIRKLLKMKEARGEVFSLDEEAINSYIVITIRKMMKPNDSFENILIHTAGRLGYEELEDIVIALSEIIEPEKEIQKWVEKLYLLRDNPTKKSEILRPKIKNIEKFVEELEYQYIKIRI